MSSKLSTLERAIEAIGANNVKFTDGGNFLWIQGRWQPASLTDIMRAANRSLVKQARPQITNNPAWVVRQYAK